jgi:hypothetical protein
MQCKRLARLARPKFTSFPKVLRSVQYLRPLGDVHRTPPRSSGVKQLSHRLGLASLMTGSPLPVQLPPLSSSRAKQPG